MVNQESESRSQESVCWLSPRDACTRPLGATPQRRARSRAVISAGEGGAPFPAH